MVCFRPYTQEKRSKHPSVTYILLVTVTEDKGIDADDGDHDKK